MENTVRFWGVRGSIPTPGPATAGVGGNTSCVDVTLGAERIIIDGGSGLRHLGQSHGAGPLRATLLFSHLHWDHIQGIPFFGPLYHPESRIHLIGPHGLHEALARQMSVPTFPIGLQGFAARLSFEAIAPGAQLELGHVTVRTTALNHPGGAIGYRLQHGQRSVVYACDHEHGDAAIDHALAGLARDAELLIYDAHFLPEEYPGRVGWGHSTYEVGAALANAAGVRALALTHHAPTRDDEAVEQLERRAHALSPRCFAAREGGSLRLARAPRWCPPAALQPTLAAAPQPAHSELHS